LTRARVLGQAPLGERTVCIPVTELSKYTKGIDWKSVLIGLIAGFLLRRVL